MAKEIKRDPFFKLVMSNLTDNPDYKPDKGWAKAWGIAQRDIEIYGKQAAAAWDSICDKLKKAEINKVTLNVSLATEPYSLARFVKFEIKGWGGKGDIEFVICVPNTIGRCENPFFMKRIQMEDEVTKLNITDEVRFWIAGKIFEAEDRLFAKVNSSNKGTENAKIVLWKGRFWNVADGNDINYFCKDTDTDKNEMLRDSNTKGFMFDTEFPYNTKEFRITILPNFAILSRIWERDQILYDDGDYKPTQMSFGDLELLEELYRNGKSGLPDFVFDEIRESMNVPEEQLSDVAESKILSQDKIRDVDKLEEWIENTKSECVASWKLDGCAIRLHYKGGNFISAETKGKARDVTELMKLVLPYNLTKINSVPRIVPKEKWVLTDWWVTGELVTNFGHRQDSAGFLLRKDAQDNETKDIAERLKFVVYDSNLYEVALSEQLTYTKVLDTVRRLGFETVECKTISHAEEIINGRFERACPAPTGIDIDGVVIRINTIQRYLKAGATSHHPKGSIAFKFEDEWKGVNVGGFEVRFGDNNVYKVICKLERDVRFGEKKVSTACTQFKSAEIQQNWRYEGYRYRWEVKIGDKWIMLDDIKRVEVCLRGKVIPQFRIREELL